MNTFARRPIEAKGKTLIHSVCKNCGDSRLLSYSDGTLEAWETEHDCRTANVRPRFLT